MPKLTSNTALLGSGALWRMPTVEAYTGLSRSEIYRRIGAHRGGFPSPVKLGPRAVAWRAVEVQNWVASLPVVRAK